MPVPARGRIDFLVYDDPAAPALTLFENKRQIMSTQALAQAVAQAHGYARALHDTLVCGGCAGGPVDLRKHCESAGGSMPNHELGATAAARQRAEDSASAAPWVAQPRPHW